MAKELNCGFANFYSAMAHPGSCLQSLAKQKGWPLPENWSGHSQRSYDCLPLPTASMMAAGVLRFRDDAFHGYFADLNYLNMVVWRFGADTRAHVEAMARHRLPRRLLEQSSTDVLETTA